VDRQSLDITFFRFVIIPIIACQNLSLPILSPITTYGEHVFGEDSDRVMSEAAKSIGQCHN
jgi:hypothetical protein